MTLVEAKAKVYDLLAEQQRINKALEQANQMVIQLQQQSKQEEPKAE